MDTMSNEVAMAYLPSIPEADISCQVRKIIHFTADP
jgi:hypothetical protein